MNNREILHAVENSFKIPGLYRRGEAAFLYRLACRKGLLVELGCYLGRSTSILLQAAKVWGASVVSVDAFSEMPNDRTRATPDKWKNNLKSIGLSPSELIVKTTDEAVKNWTREISLLFIDANHELSYVVRDLENWTPFVKVGGIVALHDMFYLSITGVATAVAQWWQEERNGHSPKWQLIGLHDYTIAFKRISS